MLKFGFTGSGWLLIYQAGVAQALRKLKISENAKYIGASGGSIVIALLVCEVDMLKLRDCIISMSNEFRRSPLFETFILKKKLDEISKNFINEEKDKIDRLLKQHVNVEKKLNIVVTEIPSNKSVIINNFKDSSFMHEAILCSSNILPFGSLYRKISHQKRILNVIDGGISTPLPSFEDETIICSPFKIPGVDLYPSSEIPFWWFLYPPNEEKMLEIFDMGVKDTMKFAYEKGIVDDESINKIMEVNEESYTFYNKDNILHKMMFNTYRILYDVSKFIMVTCSKIF